jgi:SAM-dependent methyltransferase
LNLAYLLPRFVRHFLPEKIVRFLLLRSIVIRPGLETLDPQAAVQRYTDVLAEKGLSLRGKRVMVFGYGGRFDIGAGLLRAGAASVILCEKFAPPDDAHNQLLLEDFQDLLVNQGGRVRPRGQEITLLEADIRDVRPVDLEPVDLVISNSVFEHVDDVEGILRALAVLTSPEGLHIHFVDLRDHFFKYPFEMLRYSKKAWYGWLNPSSNHNRYRIWDYRRAFEHAFQRVEISVLARDEAAFNKALPGIRPEFISGNLADDAVTLIRVIASQPGSLLAKGIREHAD